MYQQIIFNEMMFDITCCFLFVYFNFILLSRESDGATIFWTNPHSLRSCGIDL